MWLGKFSKQTQIQRKFPVTTFRTSLGCPLYGKHTEFLNDWKSPDEPGRKISFFYENCRNSRALIFIVTKRTNKWNYICTMRHRRVKKENLTICCRKKQIDVSFICPIIDKEFRQKIVKVVCGSTLRSTSTLTMLWRNSWSITGQTHEKWRQFVNFLMT